MTKKVFIIAGEASGDLLGSKLIKELKLQLLEKNQEAKFVGVGGSLMKQEGLTSIFPMEELSVMGVFEVIPHIPKLLRRITQTAQSIIAEKPDFIITIDSPDFNFRVIRKLKNLDQVTFDRTKKIHLIAPSVWAYRPSRAKKISKLYDLLFTILPFEPPYFTKHGLKTIFIGHPVIESKPDLTRSDEIDSQFRKKHKIKNDDLILCLTPGSRCSEVSRIFPEFIAATNLLSKKIPNLKVIIPLVLKTRELVTNMAAKLEVEYFLLEEIEKKSGLYASNFALAKSGTNTLELSIYNIPMIVAYKVNSLTALLAKMLLKIKFANLVNLILNREVIPELIQENCTANRLADALERLILNKNLSEKQIAESQIALNLLGLSSPRTPSSKAAYEILNLL